VGTVKVNDLLKIAVKRGASDLHLKVGSVPMLRLRGELTPAPGGSRLTEGDRTAAMPTALPSDVRDTCADNLEVDMAYGVAGLGRFRCNTFQHRGREQDAPHSRRDLAGYVAVRHADVRPVALPTLREEDYFDRGGPALGNECG